MSLGTVEAHKPQSDELREGATVAATTGGEVHTSSSIDSSYTWINHGLKLLLSLAALIVGQSEAPVW